MRKINEILSQRTDISLYLAHLTKDTEQGTAFNNLISILTEKRLRAFNHHCIYSPILKKNNPDYQHLFNTVCFTETPLDKIQLLTNIEERKVNMQPYGVIFTKDTIRTAGGNPVFYLCDENKELRDFVNKSFGLFQEKNNLEAFSHFASLVNVVKKNHNFSWEREWRIKGDYSFEYEDLFAVIASRQDHSRIRQAINDPSFDQIFIIDPTWNMEEIVLKLTRCFKKLNIEALDQ